MTKPTYDELLARVAQLEQQLQQCSAQAGALGVTNEALGASEQRKTQRFTRAPCCGEPSPPFLIY